MSNSLDYPLRQRLNDEFHARPPIPLIGPILVSHLAFLHNNSADQQEHLTRLANASGGRFLERSGWRRKTAANWPDLLFEPAGNSGKLQPAQSADDGF